MSTLQSGSKAATNTLTRFIEGEDHRLHPGASPSARSSGPDPEHRDFWDDFNAAGEARSEEQHLVGGTAAKKSGPDPDKLDFWDDFAAAGEARASAQDANKKTAEPERKGFWDEFSTIGGAKTAGGTGAGTSAVKAKSSIGTAAVRRPAGGGSKNNDEWSEW
jgi:hypothetical protein